VVHHPDSLNLSPRHPFSPHAPAKRPEFP
jgi:hypothetical protein